jgi:glycosyltransferase involved in cell wall biosynthesis
VILVRNGIRVPETVSPRDPDATELVLAGGYGYPPNLAAATQLVEEVLPLVRLRRPGVRVTLIGPDLPAGLAEAWTSDAVRYLGVVATPDAYTSRAAALAFFPSWSTGTPLKVAEALAQGVPVVCNEPAAKGLGLTHREHALIGASPEQHAAHVLEVLDNPDLADALRQAGHAFAHDQLSREAIGAGIRRHSAIVRRDVPSDATHIR